MMSSHATSECVTPPWRDDQRSLQQTVLAQRIDTGQDALTGPTSGRADGRTAVKFEISHTITLPAPIVEVFPLLARAPDLERVLALSPMLRSFRLLETRPGPTAASEVIVFEFVEEVPVLGPWGRTRIPMRCEQTVDADANRVDYRSHSLRGVGITVHKERTFESRGAATRVSETVHGEAPPGIHLLARRSARRQHVLHMERYGELLTVD